MFTTTKKKHLKLHKKTIKKIHCNPSNKTDLIIPQSCMKKSTIRVIKEAFNEKYPEKAIKTNNPKTILNELTKKVDNCSREDCWLELIDDEFLRDSLKNTLFAPVQPEEWKNNPTTWLTNHDILNVLNQYETAYPNFRFIGPTPIDFDDNSLYYYGKCVCPKLCKMDINKYISDGIHNIGIVFNLDKHTSSGSHWVSMFIDLQTKHLYYFDSNGIKPPTEIKDLIDKLQKENQFKSHINEFEHQKQNSECGMYSMYFIISMLTEKLDKKSMNRADIFNHLQKVRVSDNKMKKLRDKYFNK